MRTIRGRLILAFFSVILVLIAGGLVFFLVNARVIAEYRAITDVMTAEYKLVNTMPKLIDAFNRRMQSAGTDTSGAQGDIDSATEDIKALTSFLDSSITDTDSRASYLGFKSSVSNLTAQISESLARFEGGNIKDYFADFNEANKLYGFVKENGTTLLFSELQYASTLRDTISRTYLLTVLFGFASLLVLLLGCVAFVLRFATMITAPLKGLAEVAEKIARGDADARINPALLSQKDETGSLAQSFDTMLGKLFENIQKLDASNKEIAKNAELVGQTNSELERLNKFMVDRELKMVELKKQNEALSIQLKSRETGK